MIKLTEKQIKILLPYFNNQKYAGSISIATKLLEQGVCLTTTDKIWVGGVGDYISSKESEQGVGIFELTLDIPGVITHLEDPIKHELGNLKGQIAKINTEVELREQILTLKK